MDRARILIDPYIASTSSIAVKECMKVASLVLGFEILELWTESKETTINCIYLHASDEVIKQSPGIITGHYPDVEQAGCQISPKVNFYSSYKIGKLIYVTFYLLAL